MSQRIFLDRAYDFMLAGRAFFTVFSTTTQNQRKYIINKKAEGLWWVFVPSVNPSKEYIGYLRGDVFIVKDDVSLQQKRAEEIKSFKWIWDHVVKQTLPDNMHILNSGNCAACGRKLTDAFSIESGIGPDCRKKLGISSLKTQEHAHTGKILIS